MGDLHLSLRLPQNQAASPLGQGLQGLEQLINHVSIGLYRSTVEGQLVMANASLARMFGYDSPEEMMEHVTDIAMQLYVEPERRKDWCQIFENQEVIGPVLWQGHRHNHDVLWLEEQARVIRDSHGRILGYEGIVLNVTERYNPKSLSQHVGQKFEVVEKADVSEVGNRNAQLRQELADAQKMIATLREQIDRFHVATIGSQEGLWEGNVLAGQSWDFPGNPAWYSPQFLALLGFEEDEFSPVLGSWASRLHPEDRDQVFQAMRDHIEHQVPYDVESRLKTKQGEYRWFKGKGRAVFDEEGRFVRGGGTIRDITDQKEAEEAVNRKHALLTTVVEGTRDIIFVKDHDGRYLLINSTGAAVLRHTIEEIIGKTDIELFPNGAHPLFMKYDQAVMRERTPQSFEIDVEHAEAVSRTFLVTKDIFGQTEEGLEGVFCIARDITFRKSAELIIQEREKRYRAIMENAYDLIAEVDRSGALLYVSPNFEKVLGYVPQQLLGSNLFSFVHPEDHTGVEEEFNQGMQARGAWQSIYRYQHHHGEYHWFESTGRVFHNALGYVRGVIVSRDITGRKKSEEALEAIVKGTVEPGSQNFFENLVRQLAHTLQVPMVFLTEQRKDTFPLVYVLACWQGDHVEGDFTYDCLDGPCEQVYEGHSVYVSQGVQEVFPESSTVKTFNLEGYWGTPLLDSAGGIVGSLAIMDQKPLSMNAQDRSLLQVFAARAGSELERKRTLEALQESRERYRALYDEAPLMYFTVDVHLTVLSVNKFGADILGYDKAELVGQSVMTVVDPEDQEIVWRELQACLASVHQASQKVFRKVKKDGTRLWVRETCRSIVGPNQQPMLLLSCEDITDRKYAEEALAQSEQQLRHAQKMEAIGTLAGGIAHDFNNILGAILGYSELALAQVPKESRLTSYLEEILTAGNRAKELVKQILSFSRRSDREREAVDLNDIVQEALGMVRATLPSSIEIQSVLAIDSAVIFADPTQIHQVIMNLCTNAEQAMREEGGVLSLAVTSVEVTEHSIHAFPEFKPVTYLQLSIQDSGKGMPCHVLDRIFEPFFTTKELGKGTGLGLAVVHGIIAGHEGHISVQSVVGQGTTFTISFPRLDVALPVEPEKVVEWPQGTGKVLFVDDEEVLARWGGQVLTHLGYTVITKTNPHEAVELFEEEPDAFDVVVTDQTMPLMSGETFARILLNIREDIPIVLCTGFSHTMSAEKAKQLGLQGFLMKPVNGAVLAKTLRDILSRNKK